MINIIVFMGPSASGKSTIRELMKLKKVITYTTRPKRENEIDGIDYHFTDEDTLKYMINNGKLLEYSKYGNYYYGSSIISMQEAIDKNEIVSIILDKNGAMDIKRIFKEKVLIIGVKAPINECIERMEARREKDIEVRVNSFNEEIQNVCDISDIIINNSKSNWGNIRNIICIIRRLYEQKHTV